MNSSPPVCALFLPYSFTQLFTPYTAPRVELPAIALRSLAGMFPEADTAAFQADFALTISALTAGMDLTDLKTSVHVATAMT